MRLGRENAGFIAFLICLCSSPVTVKSPCPVINPSSFRRYPGYPNQLRSPSILIERSSGDGKVRTLGYSNQSLTRILCNASGFMKTSLSTPIGPVTRNTGPYCFTHFRYGIPGFSLRTTGYCPRRGLPRGGPGTERRGEKR